MAELHSDRPAGGGSTGRERSEVAYLWPETLQVPVRPPALVYLDLNHWISLAKAQSGHPDGRRHVPALERLTAARTAGEVVLPISDTILFEVAKIGRYEQRRSIREVIEPLSGFFVVTARSVISTHEIEAMLDKLVGPSARPINRMDYLDWGIARAFGMVGGFRIRSADGSDVTAEARASFADGPEEFDRLVAEAELGLQRDVLDGPAPHEEEQMRTLGWKPHGGSEVAEQRARQELEQVERFDADPRWRRGRIRDVVASREVIIELFQTLEEALSDRGVDFTDVFPTADATRRNFDAMPSFDVAVTLKAAYHRDTSHRWTTNDIHDIDALGSTLPYCDIVATDKAAATAAQRSGLAERLGTRVFHRLDELAEEIDGL
jgi:hypothetical protein